MWTVFLVAAIPFAALSVSVPLAAQDPGDPSPRWAGDFTVLAGNALASGVASGLGAWIRGEEVGRAFSGGALGGGLSFSGKWMSARYPEGGGLVGRQLSEAGHSVAANAAKGEGLWSELWLALGPVRVRVRGDASPAPVRVNLFDLAVAAEFALRSETRFAPARSLATGTFVYDVPDRMLAGRTGHGARGTTRGSVVLLSGAGDFDRRTTLGHELVHVIQGDFLTRLASSPVERHLWTRLGWESGVLRSLELINGRLLLPDPLRDLIEAEAVHLDRRER